MAERIGARELQPEDPTLAAAQRRTAVEQERGGHVARRRAPDRGRRVPPTPSPIDVSTWCSMYRSMSSSDPSSRRLLITRWVCCSNHRRRFAEAGRDERARGEALAFEHGHVIAEEALRPDVPLGVRDAHASIGARLDVFFLWPAAEEEDSDFECPLRRRWESSRSRGGRTRLRSDHGMRPYILRIEANKLRLDGAPAGSCPSSAVIGKLAAGSDERVRTIHHGGSVEVAVCHLQIRQKPLRSPAQARPVRGDPAERDLRLDDRERLELAERTAPRSRELRDAILRRRALQAMPQVSVRSVQSGPSAGYGTLTMVRARRSCRSIAARPR